VSAEILRRAASLMRERAEACLGDRPEWFTEVDGYDERNIWTQRDEWDYAPQPVLSEHDLRKTPGAFDHFAAFTPAVALAVADWLDDVADTFQNDVGFPAPEHQMAFAPYRVARTYLGEIA